MATAIPERQLNDVKLLDEIGKGTSCTVYKAELDGQLVAVKRHSAAEAYKRELKNLKRLYSHVNLINIVATLDGGKRMFVVDLAVTDVSKIVYDSATVSKIPLVRWAREICVALAFVHSREVIHFDVKPANLLLDDAWTIKLSDFGISRRVVSTRAQQGATMVYCAPETVLKDAADLTPAVDIYAYAIVLWELLHRKEAYEDTSFGDKSLLEAVVEGQQRPEVQVLEPKEIVAVMRDAWQPSPQSRPTAGDIIKRLKGLK